MMKSHLLIRKMHGNPLLKLWMLCIFSLLSFAGTAQTVAYYGFSQNQGSYTALTNPTNIATSGSVSGTDGLDDQVYALDNVIPFNFSFNGQNYTSVKVFANGFLTFGESVTNTYDPISATTYNGVIAPLACDLQGLYNINGNTAAISYQVVGTAPQREFVVEWRHFRPYTSSAATAATHHNWNFQARLKEDGTIRFVYDCAYAGMPSSTNTKVGLRGTTSADYTNRYATGVATSNWGSTVPGTYSSQGIATNYSFLPAQGLTFTWTPPTGCQVPTAQPTTLALTNTGIIINASFTAATPAADRYLVLRNLAGTTPNTPVNGTVYTTGQNESLNSYVAYYGTGTSFENNYNHGIRGNNQYVYTIYAVSSNCTGGPLYNTTAPLTGSIINCPATVNSITSNSVTSTGFNLAWPATENGTANTFNTVLEVATNSTFTNMVAGSPFTLSSATLSQAITGLQPNTQYFYRAKNVSTQCESSYSSVGNLYTGCVPTSALYEGFDGVTGTALPNCWSKILVGGSSTPSINVTTTDNFSAPNNVSFYGNGADTDAATTKIILVSPELTNAGAGTNRLRFKARKTTANNPISLRVVALNGNTATANVTVIQTITDLTTTYQEFVVNFDGFTGNATHVGIQRVGGSTYSYMYVDDVIWETIPTCPELQSVTASATAVGATVSWVNSGAAPQGGYEYFVSATNTPPAETQTFTQTAQTSVSVTGLASGTYYVFVRRICSATDKSPWKQVAFTTIPTTPAPWTEEFLTSSYPTGWTTTNWSLGTQRGVTGNGNSATSLYKNLYSSAATGTFTTIAVGPLNAPNYELSFYYKVSNFSSPYTTPAEWGSFNVQVSTDFGATWTTLETITNQADSGAYKLKTYSLAAYQGQYVQAKILATWITGDYDLSFDNFQIKAPAITVQDVAVTVANNAAATITEEGGILQLQAVVNPTDVNQNVTWSVVSGSEFVTVSATGLITAVANGTATVRATSVADTTKFDDIEVVVNVEPTVSCAPVTTLYENFDTLACCDMGVVPTCWDSILLGGASQIISSSSPASGTSQIYQTGYGAGKISIVVLPQLSNINAGTHQFRFKAKANSGPGTLEFGYITNVSDANTFVVLETITISNNTYSSAEAERIYMVPTNVPLSARLAIRNPGTTWAGMYWDDVYWEPIAITSVAVATTNNADAQITEEGGTLQLEATVNPAAASQAVTWSIVSGTEFVSVSQDGVVTAIANGVATVRATSVADTTKFDDIEVTVNIEEGYCIPSASIAVLTTNVQFSNINNSSSTTANQVYEDFTAITGNVTQNQAYTLTAQSAGFLGMTNFLYLHVYIDWNQNNVFDENEFYINTTAGAFNKEITVPASALTGTTRMRVIIKENTTYSPCTTSTYGQTEDYTLNVSAPVAVTSVTVSTQNDVDAQISEENGTLQLEATVNPADASQEVTWSVISGAEFVSVNEDGLVTAIANGVATVRATSVADTTKFDDIEVTVAVAVEPAGYCEVGVDFDVEPISLVSFANINNATSATVNATPAYEDFTAMVANINQGQTYTLTVKGNTVGEFTHDVRVFIDWNQDMVFDMATEYHTVPLNPSTGTDTVEATLEITVPENALLGNTRMRITKDQWNIYEEGEFDACTNAYYGQVEDYTVNVSVAPVITSVVVSTAGNAAAEITTENGTLQLEAVVNPTGANQQVIWSVVSGDAFATVSQNGLVTALANGTVTVRATAVADATKFDDIEVTINYEVVTPVESVTVSVENEAEPLITTENGTLQLEAEVNPTGANQQVVWSIVSGDALATLSEDGLVTALANGTVTVRATSVADATKYDDIEIVIDQIAGISNPDKAVFTIYPNPAQDVVTVSSAQAVKQISIYSQLGQLVITQSNTATINVSGIAAGVYIIETRFENGAVATQKLIKS